MKYKRFTNDEIEKANSSSVVDYIRSLGLEMKRKGKSFKIEGYGGLFIDPYKNRWYCFSKRKGGGPIQLVMFMENKTWVEAMKTIIDFRRKFIDLNKSYSNEIKPMKKEKRNLAHNKKLKLPSKNNTYKHMIAYLIKTRGIDKDVVYKLIKNKILYEDERKNCVFVGYDKENKPRYAGLRGTNTNSPFKGEVAGSQKKFSFNIQGSSNKIYVFESPIEVMSYLTLNKNTEGIENHHMLSLAGVSDVDLERYLKDNPSIKEINLCLNNDETGVKATSGIKDKYKDKYLINVEYPMLEDWNEELTELNKHSITETKAMAFVEIEVQKKPL